jgi:hypothetical protein
MSIGYRQSTAGHCRQRHPTSSTPPVTDHTAGTPASTSFVSTSADMLQDIRVLALTAGLVAPVDGLCVPSRHGHGKSVARHAVVPSEGTSYIPNTTSHSASYSPPNFPTKSIDSYNLIRHVEHLFGRRAPMPPTSRVPHHPTSQDAHEAV